jgi:outer membrane receptor protein involved in Fe transport
MSGLFSRVRFYTRISVRVLSITLFMGVANLCLVRDARAQEENGRIEGRLIDNEGKGVPGATVVLSETADTDFTGPNGQFSFAGLVAGTYSVTLTLGSNLVTVSDVRVARGATTTLEERVDWDVGFTDTLIVRGASRQEERIVEAPAAASLVGEAEIERKASHGQLAKLLEFTPGAQVAQGGLWDFNIGTRGFNRSLSRRVAVLLDGRDLSLPFFGYQGWPAFSFPLDDLAAVELVRGPSGALYGANASGGVVSMTSKEPRFSPGGMVRVAFGQLGTVNLETRWAGELGRGWYGRIVGGLRRSDGFAVSRVNGPEYSVACDVATFGDCLPLELVPIDGENTRIFFGGVRLDKYLTSGRLLTVEGGHAQGGFGVFQASGQRSKAIGTDGKRPWARFAVSGDRFKVATSYDGYYEPSGYMGLTSATQFNSNSYRLQGEGQTNWSFRQGSVQMIAGVATALEKMNSYNRRVGAQTFLLRPINSDSQSLFGQSTWHATRQLKLMVAARGDWSSLHDFQLSPKGAVTYNVAPDQSVRLTYSRSFQVPNSLEYFLDVQVAPPADLSLFNAFCTPFGVNCGFGSTPIVALGNEDLGVEKVRTWEAGYKGVVGSRALLTVDYYQSRSSNLATSLLPQLGTVLGRLNPRFGPWEGPAGLPSAVIDQIRTLAPLLSNRSDGSNILAAASYSNFAKVDIQGIDLGLTYAFLPGWRSTSTYSWFDFDIGDQAAGAEDVLLPNAPTHTFTLGLTYERGGIGAGLDLRWVDSFRWADGFFLGDVESYTVVDASATYPVSARVSVALNVANIFDDRHWETFGGALLKRRALLSLQYDW